MSTKKTKIRFLFLWILTSIAYAICLTSLFWTSEFLIPLISFIVLFIALYFLAIDLNRYSLWYFRGLLIFLTVAEMLIFWGATWHHYIGILLFNFAIGALIFFLCYQLKTRVVFSAFRYFTEGGYLVVALFTLFFSVIMLGKYSQFPFSCEDIETFSTTLVEAPTEAIESGNEEIKKMLDNVIGIFTSPSTEKSELPSPLPSNQALPPVENFFQTTRGFFQTKVVEVQQSVTQRSCEIVMDALKSSQANDGLQLAVLVLSYFLLVWIFKIILWIINIIGFVIFILLKPFKLYRFSKKQIDKEEVG